VLLAPMLRFEPIAFHDDPAARYDAIVVTSSNALRALAPQFAETHLLHLPLFAVGEQTAAAARAMGFGQVVSANGDALSLQDRLIESVRAKQLKKTSRLLYLAGADLSRDFAGDLGRRGFRVETRTTYRMVAVSTLPREASRPLQRVDSLRSCIIRGVARRHFSRRFEPKASKFPRSPSRSAACREISGRFCAKPGPCRSWWRRRPMKMPCLRC